VTILATNRSKISQTIELTDNAYKTGVKTYKIERYRIKPKTIYIDNYKSYNWYDFSVRIKGNKSFERRYAGRVETWEDGKTDPFMGRVI